MVCDTSLQEKVFIKIQNKKLNQTAGRLVQGDWNDSLMGICSDMRVEVTNFY